MNVMLLAAGRGERLRPLTNDIPKALVEVQGKSLLERHIESLAGQGVERLVINLGWHGEQIVARVGGGERFGLQVVYSREGEDILETGGGIHRALPLLGDDPFAVINADVFTDMTLPPAPAAEDLGHLVLVPTPAFKSNGDFDIVDGRVTNTPTLTFSGIAVYRPELFADCEPGRFPLAPLLRDAAERGLFSGELYEGVWEDVGTPDRLAALNAT